MRGSPILCIMTPEERRLAKVLLEEEREQLVCFGRRLVTSGLTRGTGGNISVLRRHEGLWALTPSGLDYFEARPEDMVVLDLEGHVREGHRVPSSEMALHREVYRRRSDAGAVVHTHSPFATTAACLRESIPAVHYLVGFAGEDVPCAPYATFGTDELAESAATHLEHRDATLLANHGLLALGKTLVRAFAVAEEIEFVAELWWRTRCVGTPVVWDAKEMARVREKFSRYGQGAERPTTEEGMPQS